MVRRSVMAVPVVYGAPVGGLGEGVGRTRGGRDADGCEGQKITERRGGSDETESPERANTLRLPDQVKRLSVPQNIDRLAKCLRSKRKG